MENDCEALSAIESAEKVLLKRIEKMETTLLEEIKTLALKIEQAAINRMENE